MYSNSGSFLNLTRGEGYQNIKATTKLQPVRISCFVQCQDIINRWNEVLDVYNCFEQIAIISLHDSVDSTRISFMDGFVVIITLFDFTTTPSLGLSTMKQS